MNRFRSILLSGLVALLMLGMVSAADNTGVSSANNEIDAPIGAYIGEWSGGGCIDTDEGQCIKLWVSLDVEWLKDLLF